MFWPGAIARIARCNPDTRRVALLRQPSGRAFSHRRMVVARGNGTLPFADAVGAGRSRLLDHADATSFRRFSYVERGFHAGLIETIFAHFPSEQVLCPLTENLRDRHEATLRRVTGFLQVPPFDPVPSHRLVWPTGRLDPRQRLDPAIRDRLNEMYGEDIQRTSELIGRSLDHWIDPTG